MNSKLLFRIFAGILGLLFVASIVSTYFGMQLLSKKSSDLTALKVKTSSLEQQERSLIEAKEEIEQYAALQSVANSIVPQEKDQARTIRELVAIASASGVNISGVTFPTSELGEGKTGNQQATNTQLERVEGIPGLSQLEITVTVNDLVDYPPIITFLERLEQNRRTSAISSVIITPTEDSETGAYRLSFGLTLQVYIKS